MEAETQKTDVQTQQVIKSSPSHLVLLFLVILGVAALSALGTYYYLKSTTPTLTPQYQQATDQSNSQQNTIQQVTPVSGNIQGIQGWKTQTFQIKKETAVSGSETITVSLKIPSDWSMQTAPRSTSQSNLITNCADYIMTSSDMKTKLTISPVCIGWTAVSSQKPSDAVILKTEKNVGVAGLSVDLIRFYNSQTNQYIYTNAIGNEAQDALSLGYGKAGNFIPMNITLTTTSSDKTKTLSTVDTVVTSLATQ